MSEPNLRVLHEWIDWCVILNCNSVFHYDFIDFSVLCRRLAPTQNLMASHVFQEISIKIKAHSILHGKIDSIFDDFPSHFHSFRAVLYSSEMGNLDVSNFESFLFRNRLDKKSSALFYSKKFIHIRSKTLTFFKRLAGKSLAIVWYVEFYGIIFYDYTHFVCSQVASTLNSFTMI